MKIKINLLLLYLLILFNTSFFGVIYIDSDIALVVDMLFFIYIEVKYRNIKSYEKRSFSLNVIFVFLLIFISSIRSFQLYEQPLWWGIRAQREWIVCLLLYFPISKLLKIGKIRTGDLEKLIYIIGGILLVLYVLFYFTKASFLNYTYDYRYGGIRLRVDTCIINLLFILCINNFVVGKKRIKNAIYIFVNLMVCALMIKTRLLIVSYAIVILVAIIFWKRNLGKKLLIILFLLCLIPSILNTTIIKDTINALLENDSNDIRSVGKQHYIEKLIESPILGRGYINILSDKAREESGINRNIYLNDNGIIAFSFMYGMIGIVWFGLLWIKLFKMSLNMYENKEQYFCMLYLIHITILIPNIIWWYWSNQGILCFVLYLCITEMDGKNIGTGECKESE